MQTEFSGKHIFSNVIWKFAEKVGTQLISFFVSTAIARLVEPKEYGTIAIINAVIAILSVFVDSGLGNALIQKKNSDDLDFSTVFFANIVFCLIIYSILYVSAPAIAVFFKMPDITPYIRVLGITIIISAIKNIQHIYVSKKLIFRKFFFASLGGTIGAGIIGVWMAVNGYGIWALIVATLFDNIIDTLIIWLTIKWRPIFAFSFERFRSLFNYGYKLLLASLLNTAYDKAYQIVIGKFYSPEELAYYDKGDSFSSKVTSNVDNSISSVMFPVLSNNQDDISKTKETMRKMLQVSFFIMTPLLIGLASVADTVVILLLREKWAPIIPYLRILCIVRVFKPIHTVNLNAIQAMGRSDIFLRLEITKKILGLSVLILASRYGVMAMAISQIFTSFVGQIINSYPNKKLVGYPYIEQLKDVMPILSLSIVMWVAVYSVSLFIDNKLVLLIAQIAIGAFVYISGSYIMKLDSFIYLQGIIKGFFNKKNGINK